MNWNLDITIEESFEESVSEEWLQSVVKQVMISEAIDLPAELSLLITDDVTVHQLNLQYRGIDQTTDVLAFAFQEDNDFPEFPESDTQLGEVIISFHQAHRQAAELGHSLDHELAVLTVHGVLHLLGYDHESEDQEAQMSQAENRILQGPGLI